MIQSMAPTRILIIDDSRLDRFLTRVVLESQLDPVKVLERCGGKEGLEYLRSDEPTPDVILLDVNMPEMTGPQLLEILAEDLALRADLARTGLFLFADEFTKSQSNALRRLGGVALRKPLDPADVALIVGLYDAELSERRALD